MQALITPNEALRLILNHVAQVANEIVAHSQALNRTLARDVTSTEQLPTFNNSAMDGYALRATDIDVANLATPIRLQVLETLGAGDVPQQTVTPGFCSKIMTGAPIPRGADAVVMREDTHQSSNSTVEILTSARTGENIRRAGSDVALGETVLRCGTVVGAAQWAMLAGLGVRSIEVSKRPRVGVIVTGAELSDLRDPLQEGQIRDSNSFALRALVQNSGAEVAFLRSCGDTPQEFESILREAAISCDAVITSGGVSVGDFDVVRDVLQDVAQIIFWKIAMKPGKPVMFAQFEGKPIFGLPGNPVSVMVAFEEFVRPALLKMGGRHALKRPMVQVRLSGDLRSPKGKQEFVRARVRLQNGEWHADFPADQGSGRLSTMTNANALLIIDTDCDFVKSGATVPAKLIDCPEIE